MSTPRFLTLPPGVSVLPIETELGSFTALEALPVSGVAERWPALLVPGYTGSKEDFIAVLQTLAQAGRRVIAVDMRGQYETPGPDDPQAYTCASLGADVESIARVVGAGEPVHLLGHSFGGLVARETVLNGTAQLASFTLMSSGPAGIIGPRERAGRMMLAELPEHGVDYLWSNRMEPDALRAGVPDDIVAFLRKRLLSNSPAGLLAMADEVLNARDRVAELAESGLDLLVLYGEHDDGWPPLLQAEMANRLEADCVVVPGSVHSPAVEAPETTAAALTRFWNAAESRLLQYG
ncbi:alpha/beta hydrolase [Planotetraspora silvatica]|uniref:Alpha/beta hydrolase n=1 Tax=Planotetraspora silvatica TaxID=234614 RepID=A0A8J3UGV1_9ACTN|nr:alpha/beta hydrolase [Planotetraspora silvatica]GII45388.1 alpha/beta hydrolase [Planotetraspora silvatica]